MKTGFDASALAALEANVARLAVFFRADFVSGTIHVWNGLGEIIWSGETWTGLGDLAGIGDIESTADLRAASMSMYLSGIPAAYVALALGQSMRNARGTVRIGLLDSANALISDPVVFFRGQLQQAHLTEAGESSVLTLTYENDMIDLTRIKERRFSQSDQNVDYPNDRGFMFASDMMDRQFVWGGGGAPTPGFIPKAIG